MRTLTEFRISRIKWVYALALTFVALMLIASSALMQHVINRDRGDVRIVNLAGRQRMLSQRLTKCVLTLSADNNGASQRRYIDELRQTHRQWTAVQYGLQYGDKNLKLDTTQNSAEIKSLFTQITPYFNRMASASAAVLLAADERRLSPLFLKKTSVALLADEPEFLALMDRITFQYDAEASVRVAVLQRIELTVLLCGLLVLLVEYLFVFRPSLRQLTTMLVSYRDKSAALEEANKKLQISLEETKRLAELAKAAENAKSLFLARMSHEIRTPLNAIVGMSYLALKTDLNPRQEDYLNKIRTSSNILLRVINDILDYSKIEAGMLTVESIPFDLETVLGDVVSITSLGAEEKQIEFLLSTSRDVPTNLVGDPLRLGQVLLNLVGNAVKFTEKGEVVLEVHTESVSENKACLCFSVRDTGIGMTQDQKKRLFAPFSQADETISRQYGGTGLGLSISQRLVELMGGALDVISTPAEGSKFFFTLKFPISTDRTARAKYNNADIEGVNVLLVDDNTTSRQIICEMLSDMRFTVTTASSAKEALKLVESADTPFRLALLDWKMPEIDGVECARKIRALDIKSPPSIIIVTAYGREEVRRNAENAGVDGFLIKPVSRSLLFDTIVDTLGLVHARNASCGTCVENKGHHSKALRGARILLAEDNEINQQVARELLEEAGMKVDIAGDGMQALQMLELSPYAALLMDMQMPVLDGIEATKRIRARAEFEKIPIIAMTANALAEDRALCFKAGMNDHICKPIDPPELFRVLERWISVGTSRSDTNANVILPSENDNASGTLDVRVGLSRVCGNQALYYKLVHDFSDKYGTFTKSVEGFLAQGDRSGARHLVHTVMGASGNIGAMKLYAAARDLDGFLCRDAVTDPAALIKRCADLTDDLGRYIRMSLPKADPSFFIHHIATQRAISAEDLATLCDLLQLNDTGAQAEFDRIFPMLHSLSAASAAALGDAIRKFDFQEAVRLVEALSALLQKQEGEHVC